MAKYLDENGLSILWNKIVSKIGDAIPSAATSSTLGLVKLGSNTVQSTSANSVTSTASRTYAVQKNSSGQLVSDWSSSFNSVINKFLSDYNLTSKYNNYIGDRDN